MRSRARPRRGLRALLWGARVGAVVSGLSAALVCAHLLREAGVRFRWEVESAAARAGERVGEPAGERWRAAPAVRGTGRARGGERPSLVPDRGGGAEPPSGIEGATTGPRPAPAIDFERFPDGDPVCAPCPVSDEFVDVGVRFAFRSWSAGSSRPHLVEVGEFSAAGETVEHALAPAYREEKGLEVGVIAMEFPGRPTRVVFELTGPDPISRFRVTAWTPAGRIESPGIRRSVARRFVAVGGGRFRREIVAVESAVGIERIELDGRGPPGHVLLVDDLFLEAAASVDSGTPRASSG